MRSVGVQCSLVVLVLACLGGTTSAPAMGSAQQQSSLTAPAKPKPTAPAVAEESKSSGITSPGATETLKLMLLFLGGQGNSSDGGASVITASE